MPEAPRRRGGPGVWEIHVTMSRLFGWRRAVLAVCLPALLLAACAGGTPAQKSTPATGNPVATAAPAKAPGTDGTGATAASALSQPDLAEYRIGPGDSLNVFVWNHPDLTVTVPVRPDGMISTPLAEKMVAAGKTASQLARDLEVVLGEYVRSPKVNVIVTSFVGSMDQIRVVGQAANPQSLPFRAHMTLLDVMIAVGGLGQFAAGNRAKIVRGQPPNQKELRVRLNDLMNRGDMGQNLEMQPGDILIIPESRF
jgi:polysaccharide biosynthesis/export protein